VAPGAQPEALPAIATTTSNGQGLLTQSLQTECIISSICHRVNIIKMNSQRKQSSNKSGAIKTDKYGVPLNYGNYKNGRLVTKKKPSSNNKGGKAGGNNARNTQKNEEGQGKSLLASAASVGLTRDAHDVIKEALLVSSSSAPNLADLVVPSNNEEEDATNNDNNSSTQQPTQQRSNKQQANKRNNNRNRRSVPDLTPPPIITAGNDPMDMGPMGEQRRSLPVYNFKDSLLETIANNRVTVVEGETGKSNIYHAHFSFILLLY
jgi:hypothetical protein